MAEAAAKSTKPGWRAVLASLRHRKTGYMLLFGFAAGLPYALLLGTLYAWLSDAKVDLETMGVFSLIGLSYAFKFLWSPALDRIDIPGLKALGKRKQWIVTAQLLLGAILVILSMLDPVGALGWFSLLAGLGAFASATQDVVIDAWRVDQADEVATIDMLSTVYQMGYRIAALVGGALALIMAERTGWPVVYLTMGLILLLAGFAGLWAPDRPAESIEGDRADAAQLAELGQSGQIAPRYRREAVIEVSLLWGWAILTIALFMVRSLGGFIPLGEIPFSMGGTDYLFHPGWLVGMFALGEGGRPDPTEFTAVMGPLIVCATVVIPSIIAARLNYMAKQDRYLLKEAAPAASSSGQIADHLYRALILPLTEFVGRIGWALILVFALVLTYRICDSIWGTFAFPFYLGELQYSKDEVAVASKFFGVGAVVLGLALGGFLMTVLGRMMTLLIGAVLAALTNLLYADLAIGGRAMGAVSDAVGFSWAVEQFGGSDKLAKLMLVIGAENLAVGIAGAAFVAWLSSIVSKQYSAVQYALLSSLTMLVGTLGRGVLGQMIEERGYYYVFILTTFIGAIAVVLVLIEWWRESRGKEAAGVIAPEAGEAAPAH